MYRDRQEYHTDGTLHMIITFLFLLCTFLYSQVEFQLADGHTDRRTHRQSDIWTSRAASSQLKTIGKCIKHNKKWMQFFSVRKTLSALLIASIDHFDLVKKAEERRINHKAQFELISY